MILKNGEERLSFSCFNSEITKLGKGQEISPNLNSMLKDESFIEHYLENQGSYNPYT